MLYFLASFFSLISSNYFPLLNFNVTSATSILSIVLLILILLAAGSFGFGYYLAILHLPLFRDSTRSIPNSERIVCYTATKISNLNLLNIFT